MEGRPIIREANLEQYQKNPKFAAKMNETASSAVLMGNGMTYSFRFTQPGTYTYDCAIHGPSMNGTIVVR